MTSLAGHSAGKTIPHPFVAPTQAGVGKPLDVSYYPQVPLVFTNITQPIICGDSYASITARFPEILEVHARFLLSDSFSHDPESEFQALGALLAVYVPAK